MAEPVTEDEPSPWLQHLVWLSGLQDVGAVFRYEQLTAAEWSGLRMLKTKRDEKQLRDLKQK